jgi:hypothetical protein
MCKTTKGTQTANQDKLRQIPPNGSTDSGTPSSDPEASTAAPIFGEPDYAPQYTFIVRAAANDNGFINLAVQFHQNSGLNPITNVDSIEQIVDLLNDTTQTGSGILTRIRIVSHVFFDPSNIGNPTNMRLRFLTAGVKPCLKRHFEGFANTSIDALKSMMTFEVGTFTNTTYFIYQDLASTLMIFLRPSQNTILDLVPVDGFGEPIGEFNDFFKICGSKWVLQQGAISNTSVTSILQQAYNVLLADIVSRIRNKISEPQLNTLRDAIINLGSRTFNIQKPNNLTEYGQNVNATLTAIQNNNFLNKLNLVRQRFDRNSKIDIRGCQIGREAGFLEAIQRFFGTNATVRPAVSGPQWLHHFNQIGSLRPQANVNIVTLFNSGQPPYSSTKMRQFFEDWAKGFGITNTHLSFWRATLGLNALTFCTLQWRNSLPTTTIPIARLQALTTGDLRNVIARIADIFLTPATNIPRNPDLNPIVNLVPNLGTWTTQLNVTVPDTSTPTQLTDHFNNFKTIYERVDNRFTEGGSGPNNSQRTIPSTPPFPLTVKIIRDYQIQLKNFIDTHASSRFLSIKRFMSATLANAQDPPAKMRYFLCLGLPFLVYSPTATNANQNLIVAFEDTTGTPANRRQNDAVNYWIRAQWRGMIPSGLGAGTTFNSSLQTPWLVEDELTTPNSTSSPVFVSPTVEFHKKIIIVNP